MPLALLGIDVGDLVAKVIRKLIDLVIPDFASDWVSHLVTWLVALPPVTDPDAFPSLTAYAHQLTAVGYGLLTVTFAAGVLQYWGAGITGDSRSLGEPIRRAATAAAILAMYPVLIANLLIAVNTLTAAMVRHPLVVDGLDKAFGEGLAVATVTTGLSLGLAAGAAIAVLYYVAALFVLKIGLTAILGVLVTAGGLVWGLHPLPQTQWLTRAWSLGLATVLTIPIIWACVFATAALLAHDTLVFQGGGTFNGPLDGALAELVKPFSAVACFYVAYKTPAFLANAARVGGLLPAMGGAGPGGSHPGYAAGRGRGGGGQSGGGGGARGGGPSVRTAADRFSMLTNRSPVAAAMVRSPMARAAVGVAARRQSHTEGGVPKPAEYVGPAGNSRGAPAGSAGARSTSAAAATDPKPARPHTRGVFAPPGGSERPEPSTARVLPGAPNRPKTPPTGRHASSGVPTRTERLRSAPPTAVPPRASAAPAPPRPEQLRTATSVSRPAAGPPDTAPTPTRPAASQMARPAPPSWPQPPASRPRDPQSPTRRPKQ